MRRLTLCSSRKHRVRLRADHAGTVACISPCLVTGHSKLKTTNGARARYEFVGVVSMVFSVSAELVHFQCLAKYLSVTRP